MLTGNIDLYSSDPSFWDKFFRGVKRGCVAFAVSAVVISLLDLANIRSAESAAAFLSDSRLRVAELPDRIRSAISTSRFASCGSFAKRAAFETICAPSSVSLPRSFTPPSSFL